MPVFEADIGIFQVGEKDIGVRSSRRAGRPVRQMLGWWSLFDAFVDEMAVNRWDRLAKGLGRLFLLQ